MPEAWALQSVPGRPARAISGSVTDGRDRRVGAREVVPVPGHRHAGELPVAGGGVLAARDLGGGAPDAGRGLGEAGQVDAARRRGSRRRGRGRRGSARAAGRSGPVVGAALGAGDARCGRGCWRPRRRRRRRRGRRRSRPSPSPGGRRAASGDPVDATSGRLGGRRLVRGGRRRAPGRSAAASAASSAAWTRASGVSGSTAAPRPIRLSSPTAWSIASAARRRPPPSSTTARPRPRVSMAATKPSRPAVDVGDHRGAGEVRLEAVEEVGRAAEGRDHALEALGGGARLEGHAHAVGAVGRVGGDAAERQQLGAERDGHVPEPAVDRRRRAGSGRRSPSRARCRRRWRAARSCR